MTRKEVADAVGAPVLPPNGSTGTVCTFSLERGTFETVFAQKVDGPSAKETFTKTKGYFGPTQLKTLPGVGDDAFSGAGQAYALKGQSMVSVAVATSQTEAERTKVAEQLIRIAVTRA